ncbi:MAG: hypothetical protein QOJ72_848 [Nocardioidaceae bacterium]|jgi:uncharacterized protein YlxW (UPF0749 family)|nr:hypothetical protein [Nocardioidaceae bacterium]
MSEPETTDRAAGLLEQIADTALDDDYYVVRAGQFTTTGRRFGHQAGEFNTILTGVVLAAFALLVMMAAVQTRTDRPATERERASLISSVNARKKLETARIATEQRLSNEVARLRSSADRVDPTYQALRAQTGDLAASGPGVTVVAKPSTQGNLDGEITDHDLQILVNGLWYAGAEAISVNGNRISSLSSIRSAGAITVNIHSIGPPYTVIALGNSDTLGDRFSENPSGRYWAARRQNAGVRFSVTSSSQLTVPAAPEQQLDTSHAKAIKAAK